MRADSRRGQTPAVDRSASTEPDGSVKPRLVRLMSDTIEAVYQSSRPDKVSTTGCDKRSAVIFPGQTEGRG
jgi:hypothetical protein